MRRGSRILPAQGGTVTANDYQCDNCHIGTLNPRQTTVTYWVEGQLVIMPNVPVWICDVCGDFEYEMENIARLEMLLGIEHSLSDADNSLSAAYGPDDLTSLILARRRSV